MILAFSSIIFTIGIISAHLYITGVYDPYMIGNPIIVLGIILLTIMAIAMGGITIGITLMDLNDLRADKKEALK